MLKGMNTLAPLRGSWLAALLLVFFLLAAGCESDSPSAPDRSRGDTPGAEAAVKKLIGKNVFFEVQGKQRRVIVSATVCLREGPLEQLLTCKGKKAHEAILDFDGDPRDLHKGLLAAGARAGSPVRFQPKYVPAEGQTIKVTLRYERDGKQFTVPAQRWVRNAKTGKDLDADWVFAGSRFVDNPLDPKGAPIYLAGDGDVICVSNFEGALLDLPINSPKEWDAGRFFEAHTDRIPPKDTKVAIILEPVPEKSK
jgi:hypothetical protein